VVAHGRRSFACGRVHGCRAGLEGVETGNEQGRVQETKRQEPGKSRIYGRSYLLKITLNSE
jgi:hypothetical protein